MDIKPTVSRYACDGRNVIRFVSGTTVLEETVKNGSYLHMYWSASNHVHRENVAQGLPGLDEAKFPIRSFDLEIDGQSLHNRWVWESHENRVDENGGVLSVTTLVHELRPVRVKIVTRLDGTAFFTRWLEITNTGDRPAALSKVSPYCGLLWHNDFTIQPFVENTLSQHRQMAAPFSVAYMDAYRPSEEFNLKWVDMTAPEYVFANHTRHIFGAPYYIARNNVSGEVFYIALAWSGGFDTRFRYDRLNKILSFDTMPYGPAPLRVIAPGETVISPAVHIGITHTGTDETTAEWHRHLRRSVIPQRKGDKRMYTIAGRIVEEPGDWIFREIDIAQEMGTEAFMVDAGWYGEPFDGWWEHRGDWFEGSFLPAGGIAGIRDYCHQKGLLFGLWMEAETLTEKSQIYGKHPEYRSGYESAQHPHSADTWEINLSDPQAAQYVTDCVKDVILNKKLDFYKLDYNISPAEGLSTDINGYAENNTWRHFELLHGLYKEIRRQNPDIALENCASGGGRNDLGMLSCFDYCCQSDFSQMPLSIRCINAMTLFLPPEAICYYHNHIQHAHQLADIDTHLRVTLFAIPIFVGFGAQNADRNSVYFSKTRQYIELAKTFCRPVMTQATVYHHTPYIGMAQPVDFCVLEYGMADKSRGYCGVFKLDGGATTYNLRLKGIDEGRRYQVTKMNSNTVFTVNGYDLANTGLNIALENINTSELILYKSVE